jgi:transketolase
MILAHTVKGKGVSYMENNIRFHGTAPTDEELRQALAELGEAA